MPTYAYACTECGHQFDATQSFSDPALTECPQCGGRLRKQFGSVGIVFKGSGFYRTDSRSGAASDAKKGSADTGMADKKEVTSTSSGSKSEASSSSGSGKSDGKASKGTSSSSGSTGTKAAAS